MVIKEKIYLTSQCLQNEYKKSTCKIKFECYSEHHSRFQKKFSCEHVGVRFPIWYIAVFLNLNSFRSLESDLIHNSMHHMYDMYIINIKEIVYYYTVTVFKGITQCILWG